MRKVLSFVLVLALVLSSFSMAFAADVEIPSITLTDIAGEDFEQAAQTLIDLGVVTGYPDKTFGGDRDVTRAEMASMVCKALGLSGAGSNTFPDARNHWAAGWIGLAQSLGIITGYGDGTFKPDANVTYYEALAMMVKALGYNDDSLTGTWPNKYIAQANKLGITDGVSISGDNAPRADIATMLYQTLDQQIGMTNKDGEWVGDTKMDKGVEVPVTMYSLLGMTFAQDVLITLDKASKINLLPYVGAMADVYVDKKDSIMAIYEVNTTFLTGTYDGSGTFETDDVDYNVSSVAGDTTGVAIFANGEYFGMGNAVNQNGAVGTVSLGGIVDLNATAQNGECVIAVDVSGKKVDKIYSINVWTAVAAELVDTDDLKNVESDQILLGYEFPEDINGDIDDMMFYLLGADSIGDIEENNVVAVYVDKDDIITKVEVGTQIISGEISRFASDKDVTIDSKEYSLSTLLGANDDNIAAGNEVKLYLAYNGDYYRADLVAGGASNVALVLNLANGVAGSVGSPAKIELMLADGETKVFETKEKIQQGSTGNYYVTNASFSAGTAVGAPLTAGALVKYSVNSSGVIDGFSVDTAAGTPGGILSSAYKVTEKGTFNGRELASNVVVYAIASPGGISGKIESDDVSVVARADVLDSDAVFGYYVYNSSNKITAMVIEDIFGSDATYGFVTKNGDNNSAAGHYVTMLVDGKSVTYNTDTLTAKSHTFYEVKFNAAGDATLATATPGAMTDLHYLEFVGAAADTLKGVISGTRLTITTASGVTTAPAVTSDDAINISLDFSAGVRVTLDSNYTIYVDDDGTIVKTGRTTDLTQFTKIRLWDTDDDYVYDVIVVEAF